MFDTKRFLTIAINEAYKNLGFTFPNPSVGCVLVKDNKIIKKAVTDITGSPHAEEVLFSGLTLEQTKDAILYVTLEPCAHYGKNPPCVKHIIDHKIKKVVIGCIDSNKLVSGNGIKLLQESNIGVEVENHPDAIYLHRYFNFYIMHGRPYITVKLAVSIDGKIALKNGSSKWITNHDSRDLVHLIRSQHDAVMTAVGTIKADNPTLNCRITGYHRNKLIIVLDKLLEIPEDSLVITRCKKSPLWIITSEDAPQNKLKKLKSQGVIIYQFPIEVIVNKFYVIMEFLAKKGVSSIFCEAGNFITKLYKEKLINELIIFRSAKILGNDAKSMIGELNLLDIDQGRRIKPIKQINMHSKDRVEYYELNS